MSVRKQIPRGNKKPDYLNSLARAIGHADYDAYLQSRHWKTFQADNLQPECYCCGDASRPLQLHHVTYERLGQELSEDVVTVCFPCHVKIHRMSQNGYRFKKAHQLLRQSLMVTGPEQSRRAKENGQARQRKKSKHQKRAEKAERKREARRQASFLEPRPSLNDGGMRRFANRMRGIALAHPDIRHMLAVELLCDTLAGLGYVEGIEVFKEMMP